MLIQGAGALLQMQTEAGIRKGLVDIDTGRFRELTPKYAKDLVARFKKRLKVPNDNPYN